LDLLTFDLSPYASHIHIHSGQETFGKFSVIEQIFAIPGMGKYFVDSINTRDYPVIMGTTVFYSSILIIMLFLVDIAYGILDPRIKLYKKEG